MFAQEFSNTIHHSIDFIEWVLSRYLSNKELFVKNLSVTDLKVNFSTQSYYTLPMKLNFFIHSTVFSHYLTKICTEFSKRFTQQNVWKQ